MMRLKVNQITKEYVMGDARVEALRGVSFEIGEGEFVAITGSSGSGKSTLMHLLGCLDTPTTGDYFIDDENVSHMHADQLAHVRNKKIGFVFQKFHLLNDLTATDNVALPQLYAGVSESAARERALAMLKVVGLAYRSDHYPYQLSGGQQQRVAIARALVNNPAIILADEPTGNLDSETGNAIMQLFKELNTTQKVTIIVVTHEPDIARQAGRIIELFDGNIRSDSKVS